MISPWGICSRTLVFALLVFGVGAGSGSAATVSGYARLIGPPDAAVRKKNDFSGVVVWLTSPNEAPIRALRKHAQMIQKDKRFSPHILAIQTGTNVDFPNFDPMFHNAFSNYDGKVFDVALYPPGSSKTVQFDRPGIVRVFCNIHPSMSAIIVVVNSSYFTVTSADGHYVLSDVTPGRYVLHFFYERATPETLAKLTQSVVVEDEFAAVQMGPTTISEAGYLPAAHKNKYGQDYPADAEKVDGYSVHVK
jgi:plastocyanin